MKEIKTVLICGIGAVGSIYANKINQYDSNNLKILVDEKRLKQSGFFLPPITYDEQKLIGG